MFLRNLCVGLFMVTLSACQVLGGTDAEATLRAENAQFQSEAQSIVATAQIERTAASVTSAAAEATVAYLTGVNNQLNATLGALATPTTAIVAGPPQGPQSAIGGGEDAMEEAMVDGQQFFVIGVSTSVNDSDGCPGTTLSAVPASAQRIYATMRGLNVRGGTSLGVEFYRDGTLVYSDTNWSVPQDAVEICLWYFISPTDTPFTPGNWSVNLYAEGVLVGAAVPFTLITGG